MDEENATEIPINEVEEPMKNDRLNLGDLNDFLGLN